MCVTQVFSGESCNRRNVRLPLRARKRLLHRRAAHNKLMMFMKLSELKKSLSRNPGANIRFHLPNGDFAPAHAHVTEVARIDKKFVDCGGTLRNDSLCRLQTWFADDVDHRLTANKFLKILEKAKSFLASDDLEVDVEHEVGFISQFPLESAEVLPDEIILHLAERHTACLAMEKCLPPAKPALDFNLLKFNFREQPDSSDCCAPKTTTSQPNPIMKKKKVLFVCIHNSARSQMAEAFLNQVCSEEFEAHSAGLEPGKLNPLVVEAMQEVGIDISGNQTKAVFDYIKKGTPFAYVITVCDEASAERCPIFVGVTKRLHWSFPDPSAFQGSHEEKLEKVREVRDAIKQQIENWCKEVCMAMAA
jgi:arsenate reductase